MASNSKAYEAGFSSKKYENSYTPGSQDFNDFERGWIQRVKRNLPVESGCQVKIDDEEEQKVTKTPIPIIKQKPKERFEELKRKYGVK